MFIHKKSDAAISLMTGEIAASLFFFVQIE